MKTHRLPSFAAGMRPAFALRRSSSGCSLRNAAASSRVSVFIGSPRQSVVGPSFALALPLVLGGRRRLGSTLRARQFPAASVLQRVAHRCAPLPPGAAERGRDVAPACGRGLGLRGQELRGPSYASRHALCRGTASTAGQSACRLCCEGLRGDPHAMTRRTRSTAVAWWCCSLLILSTWYRRARSSQAARGRRDAGNLRYNLGVGVLGRSAD